MAFYERLRAPNVFGGNPFDPGEGESPLGMLDQFIRRLPRPVMNWNEWGQPRPPAQPGSVNAIKPTKPKNVVYQERISPIDQAKLEQREREISQRGKIAEDREASRQKEIDIRSRRADIYAYKARNPNVKFDFRGPTVRVLNPATGEIADTGINSYEVPEAEQMELNQEHALERITAGGEQNRQTATQRTIDQIDIDARRAAQRENLEGTKARYKVTKGPTPSEQKVNEFLRAQQLKNSNPTLGRHINLSGTGINTFSVRPPGRWRGPTEEEFKEINRIIYGNESGPGSYAQTYTGRVIPESTPIGPSSEPNMSVVPPPQPGTYRVDTTPNKAAPIGPSGSISTGQGNELTVRAQKYLTDNGLPITPANIQHAIQTGRVR